MKSEIHPDYNETSISCACGSVIHTRSTRKDIKVGICSSCHPFFTGEQKFLDTAGRIEKFSKRYGTTTLRRQPKATAKA
jgi:large subunit ribosomal protein L31